MLPKSPANRISARASKNSGSVHTRSVSATIYNSTYHNQLAPVARTDMSFFLFFLCAQLGNVISTNIYLADDSPLYHRGNTNQIIIDMLAIILFAATKADSMLRNRSRQRNWSKMTEDVRHAESPPTKVQVPKASTLSFRLNFQMNSRIEFFTLTTLKTKETRDWIFASLIKFDGLKIVQSTQHAPHF